MLEREGIWNYVVRGTLILNFPPGAGFAPYSFWSIGVDGGSNVECGYQTDLSAAFRRPRIRDKKDAVNDASPPNPAKRTAELIETIKQLADKLASDHTSRGDLKILSRMLLELRYAFKVFSPYRHTRKVTVFGSARTPSDQPAYQQALAFGRAMAERQWLVVTGAASGIMEAGHVAPAANIRWA